jgi:UDP-glucose 4-epimerase
MRIVLTGGAGYLGQNCLAALREGGHEVLPVDRVRRTGITTLDVSNREKTEALFRRVRPELVLHLAAIASVPRCEDDPPECWRHNIGGTLSVAEAARRAGSRMVFFSSAAVYGHPERLPTPVTEPVRPTNLYGVSKAAGEFVVRARCPDSVVLRLFNVYGGACERSYVIPDVIRKVQEGTPALRLSGTGKETRDFLHVADLLRIVEAAREAPPGSVFNAGSGRTIRIEELAREIAELMGRPEVVAEFTGPRRGDFPINWADISPGNVPDGWRPRTDLRSGLREMIQSLLGRSGTSEGAGAAPPGRRPPPRRARAGPYGVPS